MHKIPLLLFFVLSFSSCDFNKQVPYKGYNSEEGSIYYKYADIGATTGKILPGEIMEISINYSRVNNSVFWDSRNLGYPGTVLLSYNFLVNNNIYGKMLLKGNIGDSMNFIIRRDVLFPDSKSPRYFDADSIVKVNVRIGAILDSKEVEEKMKSYKPPEKDEIIEKAELARYLMLNNIPDSDNISDIYLVPMMKGSGIEAVEGSRVSIYYKGYFLNHKTFDSVPANNPMDFTLGDSGQIIKGLETGIKKMRQGDIAKIIIPSHSAFGEKGSSTGIVPPYTTVIYEVTMVKVNRPEKITKQ